jgi:SET domain-containing protein
MVNDTCYDGTEEYKPENSNCEYHFMDVIANRDIKEGEELSVKYGPDYWFLPPQPNQKPRHVEFTEKKDFVILNESGSEDSTD